MHIDWSKIRTVLLDMDGTLLDLQYDNHFWLHYLPEKFAAKQGIDKQAALQHLMPVFRQHEGTLNWYCVDFWSNELELNVLDYKRDVANKIAWREGAEVFLTVCNRQVSDLRLITNAHRKVLNLKIEYTHIDRHFAEMICSHELGAPKENREFWDKLHQRKPFDPETTLFIDDSESVLNAASDYGIRYCYSVAEPDSQNPRVTKSRFPMVDSFQMFALSAL